jgi:probable HAF family extracellular repeat protein
MYMNFTTWQVHEHITRQDFLYQMVSYRTQTSEGERQMKKSILYCISLILVLTLISAAAAAPRYAITGLGLFGGTASCAYSINNLGQVAVGVNAASAYPAYIWQNGVVSSLGTNWREEVRINNNGQVVGTGPGPYDFSHAMIWQNGSFTDLGTLGPDDYQMSWGYDINDSGVAVGESFAVIDGDVFQDAFVWKNGVMQELNSDWLYSEAYGINNLGQIVGVYATSESRVGHAFVWDNGVVTTLPTLGGSYAEASEINDIGQVIGRSTTSTGKMHVCLWQDGSVLDLGTLMDGDIHPRSINNHGQIVGYESYNTGSKSFFWDGGVLTDLNDLIPADSGWSLAGAESINDAGLIVGTGKNPSGQWEAFLLTPVPEPSSLMTLLLGTASLAGLTYKLGYRTRGHGTAAERR